MPHYTISACLVVCNEELVIERCLKSIASFVDEIILVHDGGCSDRTIQIAQKFTDKIFVRSYIGEAEPHRAFSFNKASGDWILQIDADEYLAATDHIKIRDHLENAGLVDAFIFKWEMWNGKKSVYIKGLQKMCLMRRSHFHYYGVPHEVGWVDGELKKIDVFLHHQPLYNNISWKSFLKKRKKWVPIHARYFFPERVNIECFNTPPDPWLVRAAEVRHGIMKHLIITPLKMMVGQLKNGLIASTIGIQLALQQYVYYTTLYWGIWKLKKSNRYDN